MNTDQKAMHMPFLDAAKSAPESIQLFYSPGACSLAAHIALEASGLPFNARACPIAEAAHRRPEFLAINPEGLVPALLVNGRLLTELPAVLLYVAMAAPHARLLPTEPLAAARVMRLIAWLASTLHIAFAQLWRSERFSDDPHVQASLQEAARQQLPGLFEVLDQSLPVSGWIGGDAFSIGDAAVLPFFRWACRLGLDIRRWQHLVALATAADTHPAVQRALRREGLAGIPPLVDVGLRWAPSASAHSSGRTSLANAGNGSDRCP